MTKYVLEIGGPSMFIGHSTEQRLLYDTYEKAHKRFNQILNHSYAENELDDEDFINDCTNEGSGEQDYLRVWQDDENDVYLFIYAVTVVEE